MESNYTHTNLYTFSQIFGHHHGSSYNKIYFEILRKFYYNSNLIELVEYIYRITMFAIHNLEIAYVQVKIC